MVRLGQNFLADPNLLAAIVREAALAEDAVVLEVGGGEGVLTGELAAAVRTVHVVELDGRLRPQLERVAALAGNVDLHFADALRFDLAALEPAPTTIVANLPYAIATPLILRTIAELPSVGRWTVMVQREIADRLRAGPGAKAYGSPSVLAQHACEVSMLRRVDRAVFTPRPRVDSALMRLVRTGPAAGEWMAKVVRGAFAHRRKTLAGSLELAGVAERGPARAALGELGIVENARAEQLSPQQFEALAERLR